MATAIERILARIDALDALDPNSVTEMRSIATDVDALTAEDLRTAVTGIRGAPSIEAEHLRAGNLFFSACARAFVRLADTLDGARQPAPKANDGPIVWELVIADADVEFDPTYEQVSGASGVKALLIADMGNRHRLGTERYGVPLQPNNGRDALRDWYEEALDACAYGRQAVEEGMGEAADAEYAASLNLAYNLRRMMADRNRAIQCEYCGESDDSKPCNATDTEQHKMGPYGPRR